MNFIKITSDKEFLFELDFCYKYFLEKELSPGVQEIKNRIDEIFYIVNKQKVMLYKQKGYSYLKPFEDSYQDAIDFFETEIGERVKQVFFYFGYNYKVPQDQLGGYNIDEKFNEDLIK